MSEPETAPTRELAAIMFSDIAGYSAIMGRDEQMALRALTEHRELFRSLLPKYSGRMIGEIGDGTLASLSQRARRGELCVRSTEHIA